MVAVCTRKEYLTMSLPEVSFADSAWVSLHPHVAREVQGTPGPHLISWLLL